MSEFTSRMKQYIDRGVEASKEAFVKAGEKVQDLGGRGVTRIEITQLESKVQKELLDLGSFVYECFAEKKDASVSCDNENVKKILAEIETLKSSIEERKKILKNEAAEESENA